MNKQKIRIGIIGAGANTCLKHIPGLNAIDGIEIVGVCNRTVDSGKKVADQFGIPKVYTHWDQVIHAPDIDAVVIGTWPYMHAVCSCEALKAGKHVLCEARMAMNAAEAHQMLDIKNRYPGLIAQIVPSPMTLKFDRTIKDLVRDGFIGQPVAVEIRQQSKDFVDLNRSLHWREDHDLSGYNTLSLGIWYEALMRWLGEIEEVTAMGKTIVKNRYHNQKDESVPLRIPDHLIVAGDMVCGAQAHFLFSEVTGFAMNTSGAWIYGNEGTIFLDLENDALRAGRRGESQLSDISIPASKQGFWRVEEEFVGAIRGEEEIKFTPFNIGVKYMEFTEAVAMSMALRTTIHLPLFSFRNSLA